MHIENKFKTAPPRNIALAGDPVSQLLGFEPVAMEDLDERIPAASTVIRLS